MLLEHQPPGVGVGGASSYSLTQQQGTSGGCVSQLKKDEPLHEKTNILHMRKQRRRSALR